MKKLQKPKTLRVLCVKWCGISEFEENEKKCVYFVHNRLQFLHLYSFTYTTYKPLHHNHSIIPLLNHHTIIIPKSHNLRTYVYIFWRKGQTNLSTIYAPVFLKSDDQIANSPKENPHPYEFIFFSPTAL